MITVPEELRSKVSPRRSVPGSARPMREPELKRALAKIEKALHLPRFGGNNTTYAKIFAAGLRSLEGAAKATGKEALALASAPTAEGIRAASPEVLVHAEHLVACADRDLSLLGAIALLRGAEAALDVSVRMSYLEPTAKDRGWTTAIWIVPSEDPASHRALPAERMDPVRHAACAADDPTYARLVRAAQAHRASMSGASDDPNALRRRGQVAYAFPDEPWADEDLAAARALFGSAAEGSFAWLLASARDVARVGEELRARPYLASRYGLDLAHALSEGELLPLLGEALPKLLKKTSGEPLMKTPPRDVVAVVACFRSPEAAAILRAHEKNPVVAPLIHAYFEATAETPPTGTVAAAVAGATPSILRDRPWRAAKKARADGDVVLVPAMLGLDEASVEPPARVPAERAETRDMTDEELARWREETEAGLAKNEYACADYDLLKKGKTFWSLRVPDEEALAMYNRGATLRGSALAMVAKHGLRVAPALVTHDWLRSLLWSGSAEDEFRGALCLVTPELAPRMARVAARRKRVRADALAWLAKHPRIAAFGLVPDAIGPRTPAERGEARTDAEAALRYLVGHGHGETIRAVGALYGPEAARLVGALVDKDPLALDVTAPKPPPFLRVAALPEVKLTSGGALDADGRAALAEMLQVAPLDPPYAGVARVREACDPASLAAFAGGLLEQWAFADAPGRHVWMLLAVVHYPSEATTRRVASLAREWARSNGDKAARACAALAALATDFALMHLAHIAETTRFDALKTEAADLLTEAAAARRLTVDELGDRTVPELGVAPDGTVRFEVDGVRLVARLDAALRPELFDETEPGTRAPLRSFPRASKADTPDMIAARERWVALRGDLEAVADRQLRRLERAMCAERAWSVAHFRSIVLGAPLVAHVARRLVWSADGALFRIAEDGSFADVEDRAFGASSAVTVRIAHPARDPALPAWSSVLADYELLQPFEQVGRARFDIATAEVDAPTLARAVGVAIPEKKALGVFEARGYRRDSAGWIQAFLKDARATDGSTAVIRVPLDPSIEIEFLGDGVTKLGPVTLDEGRRFGALSVVAFSELVRDLEAVRAVG